LFSNHFAAFRHQSLPSASANTAGWWNLPGLLELARN
jgi:hypothetical protein